MLVPRRQALGGLAADALAAVPVCLSAAEGAEAATASGANASIYEKALPHVGDAREKAYREQDRPGMVLRMGSPSGRSAPPAGDASPGTGSVGGPAR
jgi:hypothetical protein